MLRPLSTTAVTALMVGLAPSVAFAQFGGSRAGQTEAVTEAPGLPTLQREVAQSYITIEGRAEVRVPPTEIRVVLALTSEGETAQQCTRTIDETIARLRADWFKLGIAKEAVVEDFIAVLPRYEWTVETRGEAEVYAEKRVGFRMQTNLHLAVPDQDRAKAALTRAFEAGVTDIIAFDYWSKELDDVQRKVREQALSAARSKADTLLGPLFDPLPPAINVQEETTVHYPASLYDSFTNSVEEDVTPAFRSNIPLVRAARPRNTYYRGMFSGGDIQPTDLPMKPEISVVSTVRLYFESPAAGRVQGGEKK